MRGWNRRPMATVICCVICAAAFAAHCAGAAGTWSLCNDESKHLITGWVAAAKGKCCLGGDNSPGTAWYSLPLFLLRYPAPVGLPPGRDAHELGHHWLHRTAGLDGVLFACRSMTIVVGVAMIAAAAVLAGRSGGPIAASLTAALIAFDPNLLAHFSLVSPDALLAAGFVFTALAFDAFLHRPTPLRAAGLGLTMGLALIAKASGLLLLPGVAVAGLAHAIIRRQPLRPLLGGAAWAGGAVVATVWAAHGCHLDTRPPFFHAPGFIETLAAARKLSQEGYITFFMGRLGQTFPGYFLGVVLVKTPLAILALWAAAGWAALRRRRCPSPLIVCGIPAACFFVAALASRLHLGVRHVLPIYPLLAIAASTMLAELLHEHAPRRALRAVAVGVLVGWLMVRSSAQAPDFLSSFNELAGGPRGRAWWLGDSNIDWGQDLKQLRSLLDRQGIDDLMLCYFGNTDPGYYGIRYQTVPGTLYATSAANHVCRAPRQIIAVSVMNLQGTFLFLDHEVFRFLRERKPLAVAGGSIYLYDITGDADAHRRLAALYDMYGHEQLAAAEQDKAAAAATASPGT